MSIIYGRIMIYVFFQRVIDVLKIDIELSEWPVFRDIIVSGEFTFIKSFLVEIHSPKRQGAVEFEDYLQVRIVLLFIFHVFE